MAKITISTGMRKAKVPAAMADHSMPPRPSIVAMAGGAVRAVSLVNIKAKAYSFQTKIKLKTGKYKSHQIYGRPRDPELIEEPSGSWTRILQTMAPKPLSTGTR